MACSTLLPPTHRVSRWAQARAAAGARRAASPPANGPAALLTSPGPTYQAVPPAQSAGVLLG